MSDAERLAAARFVATHWRDAFMRTDGLIRACSHPLAMTLAALDGETDPVHLGLSAGVHDAFRTALAAAPSPDPSWTEGPDGYVRAPLENRGTLRG